MTDSAVSLAPAPHSNPSRSLPRPLLVSAGRHGYGLAGLPVSCQLLSLALSCRAGVGGAGSVTERGVTARSILPLGSSLELKLLQRAVRDVIPESSSQLSTSAST